MKKSRLVIAALTAGALGLSAMPTSLYAASAGSPITGSLPVQANVKTNCTLNTATTVNFVDYDPTTGAALNADGAVNLQCTKGTTAAIDLGLGGQPSGTTRRMVNGAEFLQYELYRDAARTQVWGIGTGNNVSATFSLSSASQAIPVYGRIPGSQTGVSAGTGFTDTVQVTVNF